jgi:hypothetical protein
MTFDEDIHLVIITEEKLKDAEFIFDLKKVFLALREQGFACSNPLVVGTTLLMIFHKADTDVSMPWQQRYKPLGVDEDTLRMYFYSGE